MQRWKSRHIGIFGGTDTSIILDFCIIAFWFDLFGFFNTFVFSDSNTSHNNNSVVKAP